MSNSLHAHAARAHTLQRGKVSKARGAITKPLVFIGEKTRQLELTCQNFKSYVWFGKFLRF